MHCFESVRRVASGCGHVPCGDRDWRRSWRVLGDGRGARRHGRDLHDRAGRAALAARRHAPCPRHLRARGRPARRARHRPKLDPRGRPRRGHASRPRGARGAAAPRRLRARRSPPHARAYRPPPGPRPGSADGVRDVSRTRSIPRVGLRPASGYTPPVGREPMTEAGKREIVWRPTKEYVERSRIGRFMRAHQIGSLEELQRRSIVDPEWYWDAVVRDLGVRWTRPYERVLDSARGIQWPRWFPGGLLNFADNCVDKNVDAGRGDKPAIIWEGDDGQSRTLTYRELAREVNRLANALTRLGVAEGDRGREVPWTAGRDLWWHDLVAKESDRCPALPVEADRPCLIIYTSGTTGRPKGAVLTHGGFLLKTGSDFAYCHDVGEADRLFWLTDLGWLMGPMLITAGLFHGGTAVLFEGVQDYPKPDRLWAIVERHQVTVMGLSPTAVRSLMPHGAEHVHAHELSSLRILGSTGEPWNPEPYRWPFENVGKARLPIINYTGGTEIFGGVLGCLPNAPIKPCSFAGAIPGMSADGFVEYGGPVRGLVGELVVTAPWPGMTQGFWKDPARY